MKLKRRSALLFALLLVFALAGAALADVALEPYWFDLYDVDYDTYVVTADGGPLSPCSGPGREYYAYDFTIPHNAFVHVSQECPSSSGEKWCFVDGGFDYWGWVPVSNTSATPAPATGTGRTGSSSSSRDLIAWVLVGVSVLCLAAAAIVLIVALKKSKKAVPTQSGYDPYRQ